MERVIKIQWNGPQTRLMKSESRYVDYEGGIRSGKTTAMVWKVIMYCIQHPGIHCLLTRWTDDALNAQLKPRFFDLCPAEVLKQKAWNAAEEFVAFENGSRCYLRALKTSDDASRYSKVAGLTLAVIGIDQPEEMPHWMYLYLKGRMSQVGHPQQMILTPNPPEFGHWLTQEFPLKGLKPDHEYIYTAVYDNARNLGDGYIKSLEADYPPGHPMRRTLLLGQRGPALKGTPIYGKIFKLNIHVREVEPLPDIPILEGWDFSHKHPAVVWSQFTPWGSWQIYGMLMGEDQYLEDFVPQALALRQQILGGGESEVWSCCDPSGASPTSHGTARTAIAILEDYGVHPTFVKNANLVHMRDFAIQQIAKFLLRLTPEGPALQVHPRCATLIDGFAAGYVYSELIGRGNVRRPLKDGFYDNPMNCLEYTILSFLTPEMGQQAKTEPDEDEDSRVVRRRTGVGRAGY